MKYQRQNKILELIQQDEIYTQEDLTERLLQLGFNATQATISRDIRDLRLIKISSETGKSKYIVSSVSNNGSCPNRLKTIFKESVVSCRIAQNLVVIKTIPGLANAACSAIDSMKNENIVGTLAGDDTAFVALVDNNAATDFEQEINEILL